MAARVQAQLLGANIRSWRKKCDMTISALAEAAGIDPGFLAYIETGRKTPSIETTYKIAKALGIEPGALFKGQSKGGGTGLRERLARQVATLCRECPPAQLADLLSILRILKQPTKVRALRLLVDC